MSEPLLSIRNHHSPACGDPPIVNEDDLDTYIGYYENRYGEQWVFISNRATGESVLRGGDSGWNTAWPVVNGEIADLILNPEEKLWLAACLAAAIPR